MQKLKNFKITDRQLITGSLLCILICALLYNMDGWMFGSIFSNKPVVGEISMQENDTRHRSGDSLSWYRSHIQQKVRIGDAVFSGENSYSVLKMRDNSSLTVGSNSMVIFREIDLVRFPDLQEGTFNLRFSGSVKVAINGKLTTLDGKNSEIQVVIKKNQEPKFKVLGGSALVTMGNRAPVALTVEAPPATPPIKRIAKPVPLKEDLHYVWKVYDLYSSSGGRLIEKEAPPSQVALSTRLVWEEGPAKELELSSTNDFDSPMKIQVESNYKDIGHVYLGENFWRVSENGERWSMPSSFQVRPGFLEYAAPVTASNAVDNRKVTIDQPIALELMSPKPGIGYVVQVDRVQGGGSSGRHFLWINASAPYLRFSKPGRYQYRARSVSERQELSEWSVPLEVQVVPPPRPVIQQLAKAKPQPAPKVEKAEAPIVTKARSLASPVTESVAKLSETVVRYFNKKYKNTELSLYGFMWILQSTSQVQQKESPPVATGAGLRLMKWWKNSGFEGFLKSEVFGMNDHGREHDVKSLEGRYHYRINTGFPFGLFRELQTSFYGGYEIYRNSAPYFSNRYDLFTVGTLFEFPVAYHWSAGGEYVFGMGQDNTRKYEITGHFKYFWVEEWSLGAGYRLHLLEAGSKEAAPLNTLPYREGYTEGFLTLDYHY